MFKKAFVILFLVSILSACASAPHRSPSGEEIAQGVNTVIVASTKPAKELLRELKYRALEKDYTFSKTDEDTHSFVTEMKDLSKKISVQLKAFVRDVAGGSNAVIDGRYLKVNAKKKKLRKISNNSGLNKQRAWNELFDFSTFDKKLKYNFIER